jgi:hypothetical protein
MFINLRKKDRLVSRCSHLGAAVIPTPCSLPTARAAWQMDTILQQGTVAHVPFGVCHARPEVNTQRCPFKPFARLKQPKLDPDLHL